jgi:hypothetical protein
VFGVLGDACQQFPIGADAHSVMILVVFNHGLDHVGGYRLTDNGAAQASARLTAARRPNGAALRRLAEGGGVA